MLSINKARQIMLVVILGVLFLTGCRSESETEKETSKTETEKVISTEVSSEKITEQTETSLSEEEQAVSEETVEEETRETVGEETVESAEEETGTADAETAESPFTIFLDDEICTETSISPDSDDNVRVYITWNGYPLIDLPFGEAHTVLVHQVTGAENTVVLTGDAVYMDKANCDGQDCVNMGEVTRENLETRVLGGFIVCLPNMIVVEVRSE